MSFIELSMVKQLAGVPLLLNPPPTLTIEDAINYAKEFYGLEVLECKPLGSEKDQNFFLLVSTGQEFLLKILNSKEECGEFQIDILNHINLVNPSFPVPKVIPSTAEHNKQQMVQDKHGNKIILFTFVKGIIAADIFGKNLGSEENLNFLYNLGATLAKLQRTLHGFFHPHAKGKRVILWDVQHLSKVRSLIVPSLNQKEKIESFITDFETFYLPILPKLRSQICMNDLHLQNVIVDNNFHIQGVIDFGDSVYGPLIEDIAISLAHIIGDSDDFMEDICEFLKGFCSISPLYLEEVECLYDLIIARLCTHLIISNFRVGEFPENKEYIWNGVEESEAVMNKLLALNREDVIKIFVKACGITQATERKHTNELKHELNAIDDKTLVEQRKKHLGPTYRHFYNNPLHLVRGEGIWVWDNDGNKCLDFYNNVPHVGHCHPHVVKALCHQAQLLNTHTRYLHKNIINLAQKLTVGLPGDLSVCIFTCTGSEANDLAIRIARTVTGNQGVLCSTNAYHGSTTVTFEISPERVKVEGQKNPKPQLPAHIATFEAPNTFRRKVKKELGLEDPNKSTLSDTEYFLSYFDAAVETLKSKDISPAAVVVDPIFSSSGLLDPPPNFLKEVSNHVRIAGGLYIADEVQSGLGRTGTNFWGFQNHGIVPDIITMGKPLGNGHPIAALITTSKIAEKFAEKTHYFNTFGGNPVSCAVGLAVLEVIENEKLQHNALIVGAYLKNGLTHLQQKYKTIGEVRGAGLSIGIELVRVNNRPNPVLADLVINELRNNFIMISKTGEFENSLKIRPPLIASVENVDFFLAAFEKVIASHHHTYI